MNLRIVEDGEGPTKTFLVIDPSEGVPLVLDAYETEAEARSFIQFIGQSDIAIPVPAVTKNLIETQGETCAVCGAPLYRETPGQCAPCKQYFPACPDPNNNGEEPDSEWI
jgi:hypothetical protein